MNMTIRRVVSASIALALAAAGTVGLASAAQADTTQTLCGGGGIYANEAVWQTSTQWGRAGERTCFEYSSTQVRARVQLRIDWPSDCTLTVGYGAGEVGCPIRTSSKVGRLTFHVVQLPIQWADTDGAVHSGTCTWTDQTAFDLSAKTWTCVSPWMAIRKGGRYYSGVTGAGGDLKNDGDGLKLLQPTGRHLTFT